MAQALKQYEFREFRGRRAKYPWNDWLNGKPWRLTHNEDFTSEPYVFLNAVYQCARRRGGRVRTRREDENTVVIQFVPNTEK